MDCRSRVMDGPITRRCPVWRVVMSALMIAAVCLPATSAAATKTQRRHLAPAIELLTSQAAARGMAEVAVNARDNRFCALSLSHGRHASRAVTRVSKRHVQWTWRVAHDASPGQWDVAVACARSRRGVSSSRAGRAFGVLSIENGAGRGPLLAPRSLRTTFSLRPSRTTLSPAARAGNVSPAGAAQTARARNPFDAGQCTYHAYETRPDVYDIAISRGVRRGRAPSGGYWWDAWRWLGNAQAAGIATGVEPVPDALVVFPRGYGGSSIGHVAYVQRVNQNGSYVISERNWNHNPNITTRVVRPGYAGIRFIYGGPAGTGQ